MADHEKKAKINAKAFVLDFVSGTSFDELGGKYHLNASQVARLLQTLQQK